MDRRVDDDDDSDDSEPVDEQEALRISRRRALEFVLGVHRMNFLRAILVLWQLAPELGRFNSSISKSRSVPLPSASSSSLQNRLQGRVGWVGWVGWGGWGGWVHIC